jgi:RND family efflux transporter MFP subunit
MKRIIILLVVIASFGAIGFTLYKNKQEVDAKNEIKKDVKSIPVTVATVGLQALQENLTLIGTFEPYREVKLTSEVAGKVLKVGVNEGDVVRAGALVAQTDNELIKAELMATEATYNKLKRDMERFDNLLKGDAVTDAQYQEVRLGFKQAEAKLIATRKQLKNTTITAPIAGTVTSRSFEYGSVVAPGAPLASITDISKLKLRIMVPEREIAKIKEGQSIKVKADALGTELEGKVTMTGVKADASHSYPVEVLINNAHNQLRAGMYGRAYLNNTVNAATLTIPRAALVGSYKNPQVYVVENKKAVLRDIQVGNAVNDLIEIKNGLKAGDKVVTSGQINLENNTMVLVSNK